MTTTSSSAERPGTWARCYTESGKQKQKQGKGVREQVPPQVSAVTNVLRVLGMGFVWAQVRHWRLLLL
jgi:hypothetical protein